MFQRQDDFVQVDLRHKLGSSCRTLIAIVDGGYNAGTIDFLVVLRMRQSRPVDKRYKALALVNVHECDDLFRHRLHIDEEVRGAVLFSSCFYRIT